MQPLWLESVPVTAPHVESERWTQRLFVNGKSEGILFYVITKRIKSRILTLNDIQDIRQR